MGLLRNDEAGLDVLSLIMKVTLVITLIYLVFAFINAAFAYAMEQIRREEKREISLVQADGISIVDAAILSLEEMAYIGVADSTETAITDIATILAQSELSINLTDSTEEAIADSISLSATPELIHTEEWNLPQEPSFSLLHTEEWT